jgi:hypothetical protein
MLNENEPDDETKNLKSKIDAVIEREGHVVGSLENALTLPADERPSIESMKTEIANSRARLERLANEIDDYDLARKLDGESFKYEYATIDTLLGSLSEIDRKIANVNV